MFTGILAFPPCLPCPSVGVWISLSLDTERLVSGTYGVDLAVVEPVGGGQQRHDFLEHAIAFVLEKEELPYRLNWPQRAWGSVCLPTMQVDQCSKSHKRNDN